MYPVETDLLVSLMTLLKLHVWNEMSF